MTSTLIIRILQVQNEQLLIYKPSAMKRITYISIILCLALIAFQCSPEKRNYKKVRSVNTIEAYEEFLIEYPESEYSYVIEI